MSGLPICTKLRDGDDLHSRIEAADTIEELVTALGACVAVAERPLKNAMNLKGQSPYDIAMDALARARSEHPSEGGR